MLVRIDRPEGGHDWVNPEHVMLVTMDRDDQNSTMIVLTNGGEVTTSLAADIVAERLNKELR